MLTHQTAFCWGFFHVIFIWIFFEGTHGIFWWIYGLVISYSHDSISWFSSNLNSSFSRFFSILFNFPQFSPIFLIFSQFLLNCSLFYLYYSSSFPFFPLFYVSPILISLSILPSASTSAKCLPISSEPLKTFRNLLQKTV